jgi:methyl acetate hydrolase
MIALRLHDGGDRGTRADDFGGLADVLADLPEDRHSGDDLTNIESAMRHPWGARTIEALIGASSVREAARAANIHHSTMADRLTIITTTLKFNPVTGIGRTRLGLAYLQWRLQTSRVFEFIPQPFPR